MLFSDLKSEMRVFNDKHKIERKADNKFLDDGKTLVKMVARVVFAEGVFRPEFNSVKCRTYEFDNYNKALTSSDLGYSIFAINPYDNDITRLENYKNIDFESCEIIEVVE